VVDCSVFVGALFQEHWRDLAQQQLVACELHAPFFVQVEFANVALRKLRHGFAELASDALANFAALPVELHRIDESRVVGLAQSYKLTAYDASYLWLAGELGSALVTFDERLAAAAREHLGRLT
jgi:predicted nucleic acid-binding protein